MSRIVQTIVMAERPGVAVCHASPSPEEPALSAAKGRGARGEDRTRGGPQRLHCRDHGSLCVHAPGLCRRGPRPAGSGLRSEEHTSELQSPCNLVCRLLLEKKKKTQTLQIYADTQPREHFILELYAEV